MAFISGTLEKQQGYKLVFYALNRLSDDWRVYAQPGLVHQREKRRPDYVVVHRDLGVIVLEVKDWLRINSCSTRKAWIDGNGNGDRFYTSPVEQAEQACHVLQKMLEQYPELVNQRGELDFPYRSAGILPFQNLQTIQWLEEMWGKNRVLGQEDLAPRVFEKRLRAIPAPFTMRMDSKQIAAVHALLDANTMHRRKRVRVKFTPKVHPREEQRPGVSGRNRGKPAAAAKKRPSSKRASRETPGNGNLEDTSSELTLNTRARTALLQNSLPQDIRDVVSDPHIRLVRGKAGTGRTDLLVLRALHVKEQHPSSSVLVTTMDEALYTDRLKPEMAALQPKIRVELFEDLCRRLFRKHTGRVPHPMEPERTIKAMMNNGMEISAGEVPFLAEEITWMKETGRTSRKKYLEAPRKGRSTRLSAVEKKRMLRLFRAYRKHLEDRFCYDMADVRLRVRSFLGRGLDHGETFDVILAADAHGFAPGSIVILRQLLKPGGQLFLAEDPARGLYRGFSWREKGINVRGCTRCLRTPSCSRHILQAAVSLVEEDPLVMEHLGGKAKALIQSAGSDRLREGMQPVALQISRALEQRRWITGEIRRLLREEGLIPSEIAILHNKDHVRARYQGHVPEGVQILPVVDAGPLYRAVFLPEIEGMLQRDTALRLEQDTAGMRARIVSAAVQARTRLYLLYKTRWPTVLQPMWDHMMCDFAEKVGDTLPCAK